MLLRLTVAWRPPLRLATYCMYVLDLFYHVGCWSASAILRIATICRNNAPSPLLWHVSQEARIGAATSGGGERQEPGFLSFFVRPRRFSIRTAGLPERHAQTRFRLAVAARARQRTRMALRLTG